MTVTTSILTRAAGLSAAVAGAIFIAVQINHPAMDAAFVSTTEWVVRSSAKMVMAALALAGITGIYLRQVRETGMLGLTGFVVFAVGYLLMFSTEVIGTFVLPSLTSSNPGFVNDVVVAAFGGMPRGNIGHLPAFIAATGLAYMAGGLMFGIALFRAAILARWASALLAVGTVAAAALAVLPDSFNRPMALPTGVALIGLGVSLWREQQVAAATVTAASITVSPAVVEHS
jgi:hypothetical protein